MVNRDFLMGYGAGRSAGGGGSSNVLVAHAQVESSVLESIDPEADPVPITLDKTAAELAEADVSYISIDVTSSGELTGSSYIMPTLNKAIMDSVAMVIAALDGAMLNLSGYLAVMVQGPTDGSVTEAAISLSSI